VVALLGLVGAIATFQYGTWISTATRTYEQINDSRWIQFSAELERDVLREAAAGAEHREDIGRRALALQAWREWRAESAERVLRYFLPHNRITLINYLASAYLLLVSTIVVVISQNLSPT
jgi:hypothetical protein